MLLCPIANPTIAHLAEASNLQLQSPQTCSNRPDSVASLPFCFLFFVLPRDRIALYRGLSHRGLIPSHLPPALGLGRLSPLRLFFFFFSLLVLSLANESPESPRPKLHSRRCCPRTSRLDQRCDSAVSRPSALPRESLPLLLLRQSLSLSPSPSKRRRFLGSAWTPNSRRRSPRFTRICLNCRRSPCAPPAARPRRRRPACSAPSPGTPATSRRRPSRRATRPPRRSTARTCTRCRRTESESMCLLI